MGHRAIKQVYIPCYEWECFKNGMWTNSDINRLEEAIEFTSDHEKYGKYMRIVSKQWTKSMLNFLTNENINQKAYIGHAAVSYSIGISESTVRRAWKYLTDEQQYLANLQAKKYIIEWKKEYIKKLNNISLIGRRDVISQGYQMKFQFK